MNIPFIDLKSQYQAIDKNINERIQTVLNHAQFIMGPEVKEFEADLSNYTGSKHAIGCSSGTDALALALMALKIGPGDEVIIPDFTFFATAGVVSFLGATPVFVDVNRDTYNIDPKSVSNKITDKTKAIIAVSLYGQCADYDELNAFNIPVIEDAAQSFGATYKGKKSCNLTTIGCTSFFPSKPLGCYGDGGALFTNDDEIAKSLRELLVHGQSQRYVHSRIGMNGRLDTIQASVLIEKLKIFEEEIKKRHQVADRYNQTLSGHFKTPYIEEHNISVFAQYTIEVENREEFQSKLRSSGIPTAIHYPIPLSQQPVYESLPATDNENSFEASKRVVSLPFYPYLKEKEHDFIIEEILKTL